MRMKPPMRLLLLLAIAGLSYFSPDPLRGEAADDTIVCTIIVVGGTACGSCVHVESGCYASGCCWEDDDGGDPDCNIVGGCPA